MISVLLDTGPLVAALNAHDAFHAWAYEQLKQASSPLWTCESVLSEAFYLLRKVKGGQTAMIGLLNERLIRVRFRLEEELSSVARLLKRYADVPMSLADACLVRMSEQHEDSFVLTLDGDFRVYRRHGRSVIPVISPA